MQHHFILVIPVADRPRHIQACLSSLQQLLRRYPTAHPVRVLLADDSADTTHITANRSIATQFSSPQLAVIHFDQDQQWELAATWGEALPGVVGNQPRTDFGHKGQGVMRNLAYLKVAQLLRDEGDKSAADTIIWSLDSDQEFRVNVATDDGYVVDYFGGLDAIFSQTDALVLTGKVVGDPPVSPAVMTSNFLADVAGFLHAMAATTGTSPCSHHHSSVQSTDAAYHDMADLFGFAPDARYDYPCPLHGTHSEADCFCHFAGRVNSFFYGEHPTRVTAYQPVELMATVQPARTVYAGNYMFRPAALQHFIPFAQLRLRMSGPTLGRLLQAELGPRFKSANLPMLHKRTVDSGGQAEFRPGIATAAATVDMSGEFERQFYGDVMLFTVERLLADSADALHRLAAVDFLGELAITRADLLAKYNTRQRVILERLAGVESLLDDPTQWWHSLPAATSFRHFCANVRHNFGTASSGHSHINDASRWQNWHVDLADALARYPTEHHRWKQALAD